MRRKFQSLRESGFVASSPAPGHGRLGEFTLGRLLGQGGMGVVYEARQERLDRTVALKVVRADLLYFPGSRERFRREIEAVARLSHPGIVTVFTIGDEQGLSYDEMKERVMSELKKVFRPELLNRIDEIIVFHKLEKSEILQIVDLMMKRLRDQMVIHGATIELTDDARELLVEQGYDPAMGARPLRRSIQRLIEDPLADFVLGRDLSEGSTILIDRRHELTGIDGESLVEITVIEGEVKPEPVTVPPDAEPELADDQPAEPELN